MIEVVNEPISGEDTLTSEYYPGAVAAVRAVETTYGIAEGSGVNIQMMDERWGSGDPNSALTDLTQLAYDDHSYLKYDTSITTTQDGYLSAACTLDVSGNWPLVVGEWCISPSNDVQDDSDFVDNSDNAAFYTNWFSAQAQVYEGQDGWTFWSWKTNLEDYRWDYQYAVQQGVIPTDLDDIYNFDCSAYTK